jgi:hypothetical protein
VTQTRKLAYTAALFAVAIALVALTAALHTYGPLFGAWVPLVACAWVLSRRDPDYVPPPPARAAVGERSDVEDAVEDDRARDADPSPEETTAG